MDQRSGDGGFSGCVKGIRMSVFFFAEIASALNRIIHSSHFKRRVSLEEQKGSETGPFPSRKTDHLPDLRLFPAGANDSVEDYADSFTVGLRNDDIQEFDSKWDGIPYEDST